MAQKLPLWLSWAIRNPAAYQRFINQSKTCSNRDRSNAKLLQNIQSEAKRFESAVTEYEKATLSEKEEMQQPDEAAATKTLDWCYNNLSDARLTNMGLI